MAFGKKKPALDPVTLAQQQRAREEQEVVRLRRGRLYGELGRQCCGELPRPGDGLGNQRQPVPQTRER